MVRKKKEFKSSLKFINSLPKCIVVSFVIAFFFLVLFVIVSIFLILILSSDKITWKNVLLFTGIFLISYVLLSIITGILTDCLQLYVYRYYTVFIDTREIVIHFNPPIYGIYEKRILKSNIRDVTYFSPSFLDELRPSTRHQSISCAENIVRVYFKEKIPRSNLILMSKGTVDYIDIDVNDPIGFIRALGFKP